MHLFCVTFLVSLLNLGTMHHRQKQSEAWLRDYKEIYEGKHLKTDYFYKETSA